MATVSRLNPFHTDGGVAASEPSAHTATHFPPPPTPPLPRPRPKHRVKPHALVGGGNPLSLPSTAGPPSQTILSIPHSAREGRKKNLKIYSMGAPRRRGQRGSVEPRIASPARRPVASSRPEKKCYSLSPSPESPDEMQDAHATANYEGEGGSVTMRMNSTSNSIWRRSAYGADRLLKSFPFFQIVLPQPATFHRSRRR